MRTEYLISDYRNAQILVDEKNKFLGEHTPILLPHFSKDRNWNMPSPLVCSGYRKISAVLSYAAVIYERSKISVFPLKRFEDVISFDFSGCYMATFTYSGQRYGAHIAMDGKQGIKEYWNNMVRRGIIKDCLLYNPAEPFPLSGKSFWGLITYDGDCYSIDCSEQCRRLYDANKGKYYFDSTISRSIAVVRKVNPLSGLCAIIK